MNCIDYLMRHGEDIIKHIIFILLIPILIIADIIASIIDEIKFEAAMLKRRRERSKGICRKKRDRHAPIGKKVKPGAEGTEIWQVEIIGSRLGEGEEIGLGKDHPKYIYIDRDLLERRLSELAVYYGKGIIAVVDVIRVIDNMQTKDQRRLMPTKDQTGDLVVPYGMMVKDEGRNILLLDVDAFVDEQLLYLVLEHELKESIMTIIPYENEAIRELAANYMSLKLVLERGISTRFLASRLGQMRENLSKRLSFRRKPESSVF